jgi:hypothetical protein
VLVRSVTIDGEDLRRNISESHKMEKVGKQEKKTKKEIENIVLAYIKGKLQEKHIYWMFYVLDNKLLRACISHCIST